MDAYVYQAALWCPDCIAEIKAKVPAPEGVDPAHPDECLYDSGDWPKGPYQYGGGEADCPQHCDACGVFLENDLTEDGYAYLTEAVAEHVPEYAAMDWREAVAALKARKALAETQLAFPDATENWAHIAHSSGVVAEWVGFYEPWDWRTG